MLTDWSARDRAPRAGVGAHPPGGYTEQYANNQFRALQQFFKWRATEDPDEPRPNPMANLKPPKIGDKLVAVITEGELAALLAACKGGGFQNRRDYAVISLFRDTGVRLAELAGLAIEDVRQPDREAVPVRATSSGPLGTPTTLPAQ